MAIDCRASVTATVNGVNIGAVVNGSISDDYIQGNGVVKTRGTLVLQAVAAPAPGSRVRVYYERNGTIKQIKRSLRVLSSFADTFSGLTTLELGCTLTYQQELKPLPNYDGSPGYTTGEQLQCLNGWTGDFTADDFGYINIPLDAHLALSYCCLKVGITPSATPTMRFSKEQLALSVGYVQLINDLLLSASWFGYLDHNDTLQCRSLSSGSGYGPVLTNQNIIAIAPIGVGTPPASLVLVEYTDTFPTEKDSGIGASYEYEETRNTTLEYIYLKSLTASYYPYSKTERWYGPKSNFNTNTCILYTTGPSTPELSNAVIRQLDTSQAILAKVNGNYVEQLLEAGLGVLSNGVHSKTQETLNTYKCDYDGQTPYVKEGVVIERETMGAFAGRFDLQYVYTDPTYSPPTFAVNLVGTVTTSRIVTTTEVYYDTSVRPRNAAPTLQQWVPPIKGTKRTVKTYLNWGLSQAGQQAIAQSGLSFTTAGALASWLTNVASSLILEKTEVTFESGRELYGQFRPKYAQTAAIASKESVTRIDVVTGSGIGGAARTITFKPPFNSTPYHTRDTAQNPPKLIVQPGKGPSDARLFGRTQNKLLHANRYGVNLQLDPDLLPNPFDPLYVYDRGYGVQYRANGSSFAFSSEGIMASTDALMWGAAGSVAGNSQGMWFPVPPGTNTLPPLPATYSDATYGTATDPTVIIPGYSEATYDIIGPRVSLRVDEVPYALSTPDITARIGVRARVASPTAYVLTAQSGSYITYGYPDIFRSIYLYTAGAGTYTSTGAATTFTIGGPIILTAYSGAYLSAGSSAVTTQGTTSTPTDPYFSEVEILLPFDGATSSTFIDASNNHATVSASSAVTLSNTGGPFGNGCAIFSGANLGSANPPISLPDNNRYRTLEDSFTMEVWVYISSYSAPGQGYHLYRTGDSAMNLIIDDYGFIGASTLRSISPMPLNTWTFVAYIKENRYHQLFVNNVLQSATTDAPYNTQPSVILGQHTEGYSRFAGRLSNFRLTVGRARVAVLPTANFPTKGPAPIDPYFANVSLLLNGDAFTDRSANASAVTVYGNASVVSSGGPFGGAAMAFDGNGDYLTIPSSTLWNFGTGDWTVEVWIKLNEYGGTIGGATLFGTTYGAASGYAIQVGESANRFRLTSNASGAWADDLVPSSGPVLDAWEFMQITRNGSTISIAKNGTVVGTVGCAGYNFTNPSSVAAVGLLDDGTAIRFLNGLIGPLRVTKGIARAITVPTAPFLTSGPSQPPYTPTATAPGGGATYGGSGDSNLGNLFNGLASSKAVLRGQNGIIFGTDHKPWANTTLAILMALDTDFGYLVVNGDTTTVQLNGPTPGGWGGTPVLYTYTMLAPAYITSISTTTGNGAAIGAYGIYCDGVLIKDA